MHGFILANPQGLWIDIYGKVFLIWIGIGISGLVAGYYRWRAKQSHHAHTWYQNNKEEMDRMRTKLYMSGTTLPHDQKLVLQFVAYLEKFTTKQQSYSRESLLSQQGFSPDEYHNLREVYYGQQTLSPILKQKIQAKMT